jgi:sugar-specific transcriptional regulator TrmB
MEEAMISMQNAQASTNEQMRMFVDQLKQNISQGQSESSELTKNLVKELSESTTALVRSLQDQTNNAQLAHNDRQKDRDEQMNQLLVHLKESVTNTQEASTTATAELLGKLGESTEKLVKQLEDQTEKARQEQTNRSAQQDATTSDLLEKLKTHFQNAQAETTSTTTTLLTQLSDATQNLVQSLRDQGNQAQLDHTQRMTDLVDKITTVLGQNQAQVSRLTEVVTDSSNAMRDSINKLQTSTNTNIEKMGTGAEMLLGASIRLTDNLSEVKATTDGLGTNAKQLSDASATLSGALAAIQQALGDQKSVRDAIGLMLADLKNTFENAKKDATLTKELVSNLERASEHLQKAQNDAGKYLSGISEVLAKVHSEFATQLKATLNEGNKAFQSELAQATSHLKGAIQDLGDVLDSLPSNSK